jgi:creatinine amidohydrolase
MAVRRLAELTRDQVRDRTGDVLLLALGSTEQHGPHLPLGTDTLLAVEVAEAAATQVDAGIDVVLGPSLPYGVSEHHVFAGAASVRPSTYQQVVLDLLGSLSESGFARFFLLNGHGGNHDSLSVVAKSAPLELGVSIAVCSYWNTVSDRLTDLDITASDVPGHAGVFETSLVLALRPELVDTSRAPGTRPDPPPVWARPPHPGLEVQLPGEWPRVGGYSDPSTAAGSSLGHDIFARATHEVAQAIERFAQLTDR